MANMSSSTGLEMLPLLVGKSEESEDLLPDVIESEGKTITEDTEVDKIKTVIASRTN